MADPFRSLRWLVAATLPDHDDKDEVYAVLLRRTYNWLANNKVLPDQPGDARGEKRSRRYHQRVLPLLGVLLEVSNIIDRIETVDRISTAVQKKLAHNRPFARAWAKAFEAAAEGETRYLSIALPSAAKDEVVVRIGKGADIDAGTDVMVLVVDVTYVAVAISDALLKLGPPAKPGGVRRQEEPQEPQEATQPEEPPPEQELQTAAE